MAIVVVLNGTASAGKTSIAHALQELMEEPFLEAGIDRFLGAIPRRYHLIPRREEVLGQWTRPGPLGAQLIPAMHRSIAALARSGLNVVADHVLIDPSWAADCAEALEGMTAYLVGVRCDLETVTERERHRGSRTVGEAAAQYAIVHQHGIYDLQVDTGSSTPEQCALAIRDRITSGPPPTAFSAHRNDVSRSSGHPSRRGW